MNHLDGRFDWAAAAQWPSSYLPSMYCVLASHRTTADLKMLPISNGTWLHNLFGGTRLTVTRSRILWKGYFDWSKFWNDCLESESRWHGIDGTIPNTSYVYSQELERSEANIWRMRNTWSKQMPSTMKKRQLFSKWPLRNQSESTKTRVSKGKYNLTTKARWAVEGRNKQLDEGAGRQIWKCLDPLNCVALAVFWKHGTWVQIWHMGANMDLTFSEYVCIISDSRPLGFGLRLDHLMSRNNSSPHG